ncbi:hypothetical protein CF326_g8839 [Tilletia indica]|uniref:Uncharacterized protein n=1 Tax=Tilletia indica TaxID=43049 RepID=A0A177T1Y5_9BASI|nr:hypothetical protein CF326_g8839 [Tilletia indica]KAE8237617.1 hypothetical protein A4X13_0g8707 [Tilletia indica]
MQLTADFLLAMNGAAAAPMSPSSSVTSPPPSRLKTYYSACAATFLTADFICPARSTIKYQPYPCQQVSRFPGVGTHTPHCALLKQLYKLYTSFKQS